MRFPLFFAHKKACSTRFTSDITRFFITFFSLLKLLFHDVLLSVKLFYLEVLSSLNITVWRGSSGTGVHFHRNIHEAFNPVSI